MDVTCPKALKATSLQLYHENISVKEGIYTVAVKDDIYARVTAWRCHSITSLFCYSQVLQYSFSSNIPSEGTTLDNRPSSFGKEDLATC